MQPFRSSNPDSMQTRRLTDLQSCRRLPGGGVDEREPSWLGEGITMNIKMAYTDQRNSCLGIKFPIKLLWAGRPELAQKQGERPSSGLVDAASDSASDGYMIAAVPQSIILSVWDRCHGLFWAWNLGTLEPRELAVMIWPCLESTRYSPHEMKPSWVFSPLSDPDRHRLVPRPTPRERASC